MNEVALPGGGRISISQQGSGPPLLLIRPLGGSLVSWGPFARALAVGARVVAFDARGSGSSSAAPWRVTTRRMAADALAVLDALAIERANVFGLSLGGMVASWLAIDAPERVGRLVLASSPMRGTQVHPGGWLLGLVLARCLLRLPREAQACLATQILSKKFRASEPDEVPQIRARARARPASHRGVLALLAAAASHDVSSCIQDVHAATLVLAGELDVLLAADEQQRLAARLPHARLALGLRRRTRLVRSSPFTCRGVGSRPVFPARRLFNRPRRTLDLLSFLQGISDAAPQRFATPDGLASQLHRAIEERHTEGSR